jgi:hypothetical protein
MNAIKKICLGLCVALLATGPLAAEEGCEAGQPCVELRDFRASLVDVRSSTERKEQIVTATLRFENTTDRRLVLGYVAGTGVATDDRGNRYTVRAPGGVRGIGEIAGADLDAKFVLEPGESADARFELGWTPGKKDKPGQRYDFDFTIREIESGPDQSLRLGREYALLLARAAEAAPTGAAEAAPTGAAEAASTAAAEAAPTVAAAPPPPGCAGRGNCFDAGGFIAEVEQLRVGQGNHPNYTAVRVALRIKNTGEAPLALGYRHGSGNMLDEHGQAHKVQHVNDVTGIGISQPGRADSQFQLRPGESRSATFTFTRRSVNTPQGRVYSLDLALDELEVFSATSLRQVRQHALHFSGLTNATSASVATAAGGTGAATDAVQEVARGLKRLLGKDD